MYNVNRHDFKKKKKFSLWEKNDKIVDDCQVQENELLVLGMKNVQLNWSPITMAFVYFLRVPFF